MQEESNNITKGAKLAKNKFITSIYKRDICWLLVFMYQKTMVD